MTEIMVCGDWHGDTNWAVSMVHRANRLDITKIIQCGDFGLWDHVEGGVRFLDTLNEECRRKGVKVYFVDGNHENHTRLKWYDANNPRTVAGHVYIRSHIFHVPRGCVWGWDGKTFCGVGGAVSVDKQYRLDEESKANKPQSLWWPGEQLEDSELYTLPDKKVDYLFTHDCPTNAPFRNRLKPDLESQIHRQRMDKVGKVLRPTLWFHGHMHEAYTYEFSHQKGAARVFGLDMNGEPHSWGIIDTETDKFTLGSRLTK